MKKILVASLACLVIIGCSSIPNNASTKVHEFTLPEINQVTEVSVGEFMLDQGRSITKKHLVVKEDISGAYYNIAAGDYPERGFDKRSYFQARNTKGTIVSGMDTGTALTFSKGKICVTSSMGYKDYKCYDANAEERDLTFITDAAFRQTLIYNGSVGDKINISYREFSGSTARQAFTNDVEYDMSRSKVFSYKGARIEVLEYNNNSITYRLLSPFVPDRNIAY